MELLFNTFWVVVSLGAFALWFPRKDSSSACGARNAERLQISAALAMALVILFPSISLSDDLHAENAVMEESSRSAVKARQLTQKCLHAGKSLAPLTAIITESFSAAIGLVVGRVFPPEARLLRSAPVRPSQGRSPPFFAN
jgi:hypothetical protein